MASVDYNELLRSLYPDPDAVIEQLARKRSLMPPRPPRTLYRRAYDWLRWWAYAPHRWLHRNCE